MANPTNVQDDDTDYSSQDMDIDGVSDDAASESSRPISYDISSYGGDYTIDGLVQRLKKGAFYTPTFQRSYVWSLRQASTFIESLLLGLPVPAVFVYKEEDTGNHLIIDGQQRLKTLQYFFAGVFKEKVFRLVDVQERWKGKTYLELSESDRQKLDDSLIHVIIFKQNSPTNDRSSVYHVFRRINTGGIRLQPQEIRNCVYPGALNTLLKELNKNISWRAIYGAENPRMKDQELILRFFALNYELDKYERPMADFLNGFSDRFRNPSVETKEKFNYLFRNTIALIFSELGAGAFRPEKLLNAAVFDGVMIGVARRLELGPIKSSGGIKERYEELIKDDGFRSAYLRSTADVESVRSRIKIASEYFKSVA